ncbi:MAG TPA: DUF167 domain-containing protein [Candidatus Polarisedimenticolia bacterium]|jgi:hypothetical protein
MDTTGLELIDAEGGCRIPVRVRPGSKQDTLIGPYAGSLKMTVVAPPEKGKANDAVARVMAGALNLATSRVRVVAGFTDKNKVVFVEGCGAEEVRRRLDRLPRISTGALKA